MYNSTPDRAFAVFFRSIHFFMGVSGGNAEGPFRNFCAKPSEKE